MSTLSLEALGLSPDALADRVVDRAAEQLLTRQYIDDDGEANAIGLIEGPDIELRIETGVHHQIRATLAHLGAPILGDPTYGGAPSERVWLHAWKLILPAAGNSGNSLEIVAPLPSAWPTG